MNKATKFIDISTEDLLNGTGIIVKFEESSDKICLIKSDKKLILFPVLEESK